MIEVRIFISDERNGIKLGDLLSAMKEQLPYVFRYEVPAADLEKNHRPDGRGAKRPSSAAGGRHVPGGRLEGRDHHLRHGALQNNQALPARCGADALTVAAHFLSRSHTLSAMTDASRTGTALRAGASPPARCPRTGTYRGRSGYGPTRAR